MWIHIFKPGTHTGTGTRRNPLTGEVEQVPVTATYTEADMARMEHLYNEQPAASAHRAPVVLGHPLNDHPARAWVTRLQARADGLWADLRNPDPAFVEDVNAGRYREKSAKFYENGLLRHVAFLGAVPPAVKGLWPTETILPEAFTEAEGLDPEACTEFATPLPLPPTSSLTNAETKNMEELLKGIADAIAKMQASVDLLVGDKAPASGGPPTPQPPAPAFKAPSPYDPPQQPPAFPPYPQPQYAEAVEAERLKAENAALLARVEGLETTVRDREFAEFVASPAVLARITPAMAERTLEELRARAASASGEVEYSEQTSTGETVTRTGSSVDAFKAYILSLPPQVAFGETATRGRVSQAITTGAQAEIDLGLEVARSLNPNRANK